MYPCYPRVSCPRRFARGNSAVLFSVVSEFEDTADTVSIPSSGGGMRGTLVCGLEI